MADGVNVELKGPLFSRGGQIIDSVSREFIQRLVELGEQKLDTTLRPRPSGVYLSVLGARKGQNSTGNYRRNVKGYSYRTSGKITDGGVIYGSWLEGTSSRNQTTRFKGYASFRRTSQWLQSRVKPEAKKFAHRYIKKLNGSG